MLQMACSPPLKKEGWPIESKWEGSEREQLPAVRHSWKPTSLESFYRFQLEVYEWGTLGRAVNRLIFTRERVPTDNVIECGDDIAVWCRASGGDSLRRGFLRPSERATGADQPSEPTAFPPT